MTVVVDASVVIEVLLGRGRGRDLGEALADEDLVAPQLLALEVLSVLRRWVRQGVVTAERAEAALVDLEDLGIIWMDLPPLVQSAWRWRDALSAYDSAYVTLAESLGVPLLTLGAGIVAAAGDIATPAQSWVP